jgi:hypothetical protein
MSFQDTLHRLLGTATWRRKQASGLASERFRSFDHGSAVLVLETLVETLGITFHQLHPDTDLAVDLGADEDEPEWISMCLRELGVSICPQQVVEARTVAGLIELVTRVKSGDTTN